FDTKHYSDVPVVDAAAVLNDDDAVTVFAVNRDLQEDVMLNLDLRAFGDMKVVSHSVMHHDDMKAINTENNPGEVVPFDVACAKDGEPIVLPAASWNVIRLAK
ncbi:MAG: alpha-N-arabinofuranosidase, partial [Clostridia bacterium]|nr:alpha-N-arabinofuranosidase [Clostridia bacterium]